MPRVAKELTALEVKRLKHPTGNGNPVALSVGGVSGLLMQITASGAKSWVLRTSLAGKRREIGLGSYPSVSLVDAREKARDIKAKSRLGLDPVEEARAAKAARVAEPTFWDAVEGYIEHKAPSWSERTKNANTRMLHRYCREALGARKISAIGKHDIKEVLAPIWEAKTSTATRLREQLFGVFDWAKGNDHITGDNPAAWGGNLRYLLSKPDLSQKPLPSVATDRVSDLFAEVRKRDGNGSRALEFLAMTAVRSGEVRGARWDEIDLNKGLWIIPARRMKMRKEHRVPLSLQAVALIKAMPRTSDLVFPAPKGGELSDMTLSAAMRRIHADDQKVGGPGFIDSRSGRPTVPHGWRSAFRTWTAEKGYDRDMCEMALAHKVGSNVERAYQRSDMVDRRHALMQDWSDFLAQ